MLDLMYEVPSRDDIADVTINRAVVEGKSRRSSARSRTRKRRNVCAGGGVDKAGSVLLSRP